MSEGPPNRGMSHKGTGKKQVASSQDQRRVMNQRRQATAVQIRKQRREELFRRKRQAPTQTQTAGNSNSGHGDAKDLPVALESFLQEASCEHLVQFQKALASASASLSSSGGAAFLQRLIQEDPVKAKGLTSHTVRHLLNQDEGIRSATLAILLDLTSTPSPQMAPEDYYGRPPPRWSDLLVDEPTLIPTLISFLSDTRFLENSTFIIGNLVQESPQALQAVRPSWPILVAALPGTVYACAAIVRQDTTSYGMDFLQNMSVLHITELLQDNRTAVETAWILEALSRREDAAVDCICSGDAEPMATLMQRLHQAAHESDTEFLVPALQAIGNMLTACEGRHVNLFLSNTSFVQSLSHLLEQGIVLDSVWVAGCCLVDAGIQGHTATEIAAAAFLPRLVSILSSESASLNWKRDAACAIWNAVSDPPGAILSDQNYSLVLHQLMLHHVWKEPTADKLMEACIDLLGRPDMDAVLASLQVLDRILRSIPDSRITFEGLSGVDCLESVCSNAVGQDSTALDTASSLAENLLDDFFDPDQGSEGEDEPDTAPAVRDSQFVFGAPASSIQGTTAFNFGADTSSAGQGRGRGRGRSLPAWMQQQQ